MESSRHTYRGTPSIPAWAEYLLSIAAMMAGVAARWALNPILGDRVPFITTFMVMLPLVLLVRPGAFLCAAIVGMVGAWFLVISPAFTFEVGDPADIAQLGLFGLAALLATFTAWLAGRARQQRREHHSRLLATVESIADGFCTFDADWRYTYMNDRGAAMCGMRPEDFLGRRWPDVFPNLAGSDLERRLREALSRRAPVEFEHFYPDWDRWFLIKVTPVKASAGGYTCSFRDVTEQKRAQEAVRTSEERLRLAQAGGGVGVWEWSVATGQSYWSEVMWELYGRERPADEMKTGDLWEESLHPDDRRRVIDAVAACLASRETSYQDEFRIVRPDGAERWVQSKARIDRDAASGKPVRMYGCNIDITERKRADAALAETARSLARERERLELALRTGGLGVYEWRVGESAVWWSPELYPVFGVDAATFTPTVDSFNAIIHPDDRAEMWRKTEASVARREVFHHEYRIVRPHDGQVRWVINQSHVGLDAAGRVERIIGVAMDITDRKAAEQALREADRRKDEFLATLAHELRNPLAPIVSSVQILDRADEADPAVAAEARATINRQLAHLVRLVDDLLDVNRISRDKLELRRQPVELATVLRAAAEACGPLVEQMGHDVTVDLPDEPVWLDADPVRLGQVFGNLLNNACKYTPRGGRIHVTAQPRGGRVEVSVRDTGIGIPSDRLSDVFDLFAQVGRHLEREQGGLGIGLHLVKRLVEMHGGTVEAHSDGEGAGSEFVVRLPVVPAPQPAPRAADGDEAGTRPHAPPQQPPPAVPQPRPARILVVDDNHDAAESLSLLLQLDGHETVVAHDGVEAVEKVGQYEPDVVLLDIGLPRMNGYDACREIRRRLGRARKPVVVALTGWGQDADYQRTREAGFDGHLVKPIELDALTGLLDSLRTRGAPAQPEAAPVPGT